MLYESLLFETELYESRFTAGSQSRTCCSMAAQLRASHVLAVRVLGHRWKAACFEFPDISVGEVGF